MRGGVYVVVCGFGEEGQRPSARGMSISRANANMAVLASSLSLSPTEWTEKSTEVNIPPLPNPPPPRQRSSLVFIVVLVVLVTLLFLGRSQGQDKIILE